MVWLPLLLLNAVWVVGLPAGPIAENSDWWQSGVIYQIYPRSFKDSNNDGIGDLPGITSSLPYLQSLGVTGIWLSPIYPSPMVDFGYDIANFTDIHPEFGTLQDFDDLVAEANKLGMKIILDFVPNHSSDQHEWFKKSVRREAGYEDYYVWRDPSGTDSNGDPLPPNNWLSIFYGSAWKYNSDRKQFYLHQFASAQPDLNYTNPKVAEEMKNVIRFWLDRGVSGYRIDAIPHLFESPGMENEPIDYTGSSDPNDYGHLQHIYTKDFEATYQMVREWRKIIDERSAIDGQNRCIMVEAYGTIPLVMHYFGTAEEPIAHFPFNFNFIGFNSATNARDVRRLIDEWVDNIPTHGHNNWLVGNHDNHRIGSRIGADMIDAMNMLILSLPGTSVTYYGEEIGMVDNLEITFDDGMDPNGCNFPRDQWYQRSRDFERTPFQWNASVNAGFNDGGKTWLPIHENYKTVNVAAEYSDPGSHLNVFKDMATLKMHMKNAGLTVKVSKGNTLVILRFENSEEYMVTLVNFADKEEVVNLDSLLMLGAKTKLTVIVTGKQSGIEVGKVFTAKEVSVPPRDGIVVYYPPTKAGNLGVSRQK